MPDVLLFGATGYTGRLTAQALFRRGASFAIAGRNRAKLEALAASTGSPDVRIASTGDTTALAGALEDCRVLVTCVGPFAELGWTAVEATMKAGTHYLDSNGEGVFASELIARYDDAARRAGVALGTCMGFDEIPGDVAATLAVAAVDDSPEGTELVLTYALPGSGSRGTLKSALGILATRGPTIVDGRVENIAPAKRERWSPMPPPLGPRRAISFPLAVAHLAPRHLKLSSFGVYVTAGTLPGFLLRAALPPLRLASALPFGPGLLARGVDLVARGEGPNEVQRSGKWTILAEARAGARRHNVSVVGSDVYGLTAELLAAGAVRMAAPDYERAGVLTPVQALELEFLEKQLLDSGVSIESYGPG